MGASARTGWAAAGALLAFGAVAAAVASRHAGPLDAWATAVVRGAASPACDALARVATALASGATTLVATSLAAAAALRRGARRTAGLLAAGWIASELGAQLLKALVGRARPSFAWTVAALPSSSFPSGHAMNAVVVWGLLAIVAAARWPRARAIALSAAVLLALAGGASRVYLGVHYPTDVLGGWAAGAAILLGLASVLPSPTEGHSPGRAGSS